MKGRPTRNRRASERTPGELEVLTSAIVGSGSGSGARATATATAREDRTHDTIARVAQAAGQRGLDKLTAQIAAAQETDPTRLMVLVAFEDDGPYSGGIQGGIKRSGVFVCSAAELTMLLALGSVYIGDGEDTNSGWTSELVYGDRKDRKEAYLRVLECRSIGEGLSPAMLMFKDRPVGYSLVDIAKEDRDGQRWTQLGGLESDLMQGRELHGWTYHVRGTTRGAKPEGCDPRVQSLLMTPAVYNAVLTAWGWVDADGGLPLIAPATFEQRRWYLAQCGSEPIHKPEPSAAALACEHANECPHVCPCDPGCYCKTHTCKPLPAATTKRK